MTCSNEKHLILLGKGVTLPMGLAKMKETGWETWGLNQMWQTIPGLSLIFDMHIDTPDHPVRPQEAYCPVIGLQDLPPNVYGFPIELAKKKFRSEYFNCGVAYMIAFALLSGNYTFLHLYGIDYHQVGKTRHEAIYERPCVEYWLGYATALGLGVEIPEQSSLFTFCEGIRMMYGYDGDYYKRKPVFKFIQV